ncbi:MAG: FkbM family methyltransferase [Candidatus Omnitrophica bacterium]|nr:FkbM family methyltransferase [Candidatus Omnitrophota bacterium]
MIKKMVKLFKRFARETFLDIKSIFGFKITIFRLKSGELFRIRNIDRVGRKIFNEEKFEKGIIDIMLSRIERGMTVVDVGANIGYYSVLMASKVGLSGRVISFEPNPMMLEELKCNIEMNRFENISIQQTAIADQNGYKTFFVPSLGMEAHGSFKQNETFKTFKSISVQTEKLDDALARLDIQHVDLIKIDAEGAEKFIFEGATKLLSLSRNKPVLVFECSETLCRVFGHRSYDVLSFVSSFGYCLEEIAWGVWLAVPRDPNV